mgnify:CR=1 FL=1|tara:strand:+ start:515 stop:634 length:120 start_codon:yes stop_codon:yes gene_type:complete
MKDETYEEMERRLAIRSWTLITIAMVMPLLPLAIIYFYG